MKKKTWYLLAVIIGFVLIVIGIFTLTDDISKRNQSGIWGQILMMVLLIALTINNIFMYKKEIAKSKK